MEIRQVTKLQPASNGPKKNFVVEVSFIFDRPAPAPQRHLTRQELKERDQKYEHNAKALSDFIRTLPIGTVQRLLWLLHKNHDFLTPIPTADA